MKNINILGKCLAFFTFILMFPIFSTVVDAETITFNPNNEKSNVVISPPVIYVYEGDYGKTYEIKVKNNSDRTLNLTLLEKYISINPDNSIKIESSELKKYLTFNKSTLTLTPGQEESITARIRLDVNEFEYFPSVAFDFVNPADKEDLNPDSELYSVLVLQNKKGNLSVNIETEVEKTLPFVFSKDFNFKGKVSNSGEKFFNPKGTVSIWKNGEKTFEKELTTDIDGLLFPQKNVDYKFEWKNNLEFVKSVGIYEVETRIKPEPYSKQTINKITLVYIPIELAYISGGLVGGLVVLTVLLKVVFKKKSGIK